jgi:hypothetical protein
MPASPVPPEPITVPTITPGTYLRLRREALRLSIEDVALMLETDPCVSHRRRVEWLTMLEADAEEISLRTALVLHDAIAIDLRMLAYWMAVAEGATPSLVEVIFASRPDLAR